MMLLFFLLGVSVATHTDGMPHGCNSTGCRACIFHFIDANHDGTITAAEIDAFNITEQCGQNLYWTIPTIYNDTDYTLDMLNGTMLIEKCDLGINGFPEGKDGVITEYDFMGPFSCMRIAAVRVLICKQCWQCEAYQLSMQPTVAPTEAPTEAPTLAPTDPPTDSPTESPTSAPTDPPTEPPTEPPTDAPTEPPTDAPTEPPTDAPVEGWVFKK
jgi:hypothetical protein